MYCKFCLSVTKVYKPKFMFCLQLLLLHHYMMYMRHTLLSVLSNTVISLSGLALLFYQLHNQ